MWCGYYRLESYFSPSLLFYKTEKVGISINCSVAAEDGKFVGDHDVGEFWSLFGGYAPIPKDSPSGVPEQSATPSIQLFWWVCLHLNLETYLC